MHVHWSPRVADLRELDEEDVGVLLAVLGVHGLAPEPKQKHITHKTREILNTERWHEGISEFSGR